MTFLRRVLKNKEIYVSARTIEERRRKYLLAADPIGAFIDEAVKLVIDENEPKTTTKDIMYIAYSEFCSIKRISAVEKETFGKGVSKRFQWQDDLEYRIWLNKRLTPEYEKIANDAIKRIRLKYGQETLDNDDINAPWGASQNS